MLSYMSHLYILEFMSCLYISDINLLSVILFANIFSYFVGGLFILLIVPLYVQKLLSVISSNLFIFSFISYVLGDKKIVMIYVKEYRVCFPLGILSLPVLNFDLLSLFELNYVNCCVSYYKCCPYYYVSNLVVT